MQKNPENIPGFVYILRTFYKECPIFLKNFKFISDYCLPQLQFCSRLKECQPRGFPLLPS